VRIDDFNRPVQTLSGGQRQAVALGRVIRDDVRIVILDEPTAALGVAQTRQVLQLVRSTAARGHGVILITHDVQQVLEVADRVVVLRLGRVIHDGPSTELDAIRLLETDGGHGDHGAEGGNLSGAELLLGVDIGTASSKASWRPPPASWSPRPRGRTGSRCPGPAGPSTTPRRSGGGTWRRSAASCWSTTGPAGYAASVSAASARCCSPADADAQPLRPAILYGIDSRAEREIAELERELGAAAIPRSRRLAADHAGDRAEAAVAPPARAEVWGRTRKMLMASSFAVASGPTSTSSTITRRASATPVMTSTAGLDRRVGRRDRPGWRCRGCSGRARWPGS